MRPQKSLHVLVAGRWLEANAEADVGNLGREDQRRPAEKQHR